MQFHHIWNVKVAVIYLSQIDVNHSCNKYCLLWFIPFIHRSLFIRVLYMVYKISFAVLEILFDFLYNSLIQWRGLVLFVCSWWDYRGGESKWGKVWEIFTPEFCPWEEEAISRFWGSLGVANECQRSHQGPELSNNFESEWKEKDNNVPWILPILSAPCANLCF